MIYLEINPLEIGELRASIPIIQGGMGIGVSRGNLAGAVAKEGAIGVISGVQIGYDEEDFQVNPLEANKRALRREIRKAKTLSKGGIIGVNLLCAMNNYDDMVEISVEENADLIISGAGLPTDLPKLLINSKTKAVPIVSSIKAAKIILELWHKRYSYCPPMIIVEGAEAGGHIGVKSKEEIEDYSLEDVVKEVIDLVSSYRYEEKHNIAVIAAGGIYDGDDIARFLKLGAKGVQLGTRFIATNECDASQRYKEAFVSASKEDIVIVQSPVGLPGRALSNEFVKKVEKHRESITKCYKCLRRCDISKIPYCISKALINAVKGNIEEGLIFTGSNGYRIDKIISVKELLDELIKGVNLAYE